MERSKSDYESDTTSDIKNEEVISRSESNEQSGDSKIEIVI